MKNKENNFAYTGTKITYVDDQRFHLESVQKEKAPNRDGTL